MLRDKILEEFLRAETLIAVVPLVTACVMAAMGREVPAWMITVIMGAFGFYFGTKNGRTSALKALAALKEAEEW